MAQCMSVKIYGHTSNIKVAVSDVYGDFTYEDVYLRSWDLAKGILGLLGQVSLDFFLTSQKIWQRR